jgi:hypothetical protein
MNIPIIVVCYNNYKYVENMIGQIIRVNSNLEKNIIILDNKSTCEETINYLRSVQNRVIFNTENNGPWITREKNKIIYDQMPSKFILTDPDLELNPNLPHNFVEILVELSELYGCDRIGFALDISDSDKMLPGYYASGMDIKTWEEQFWGNKIQNTQYELYYAPIDTTFVLITKDYHPINIRVAGNFTAKHLPWYRENKLFNIYENFILNTKTTKISTTSNTIVGYIKNNFIQSSINNETFFIVKSDDSTSDEYIKNNFDNFDKFLDVNKIFVEIGAGQGQIALYAARKSKYIYATESDTNNFNYLQENCKNNIRNYQIFNENINKNPQLFFTKNNIPYENVSLIKVNLHGKEEDILKELYELNELHNIPVLITINYEIWQDKNLNRFTFLSKEHRDIISQGNELLLTKHNHTT